MPTNKISDIFRHYLGLLSSIYDEQESKRMLNQLIQHFFNLDKIDLIKSPEFRLSESELLRLHFAVKELMQEKPLQQIIGEVEFLDLKIKVNAHVLIPRPETEELVQLIREREKFEGTEVRILDIGCGSGCISIALKKYFIMADVNGLDISEEALEVSRGNAALNNTNLKFIKADILNETSWDKLKNYQLIVSNPPYVRDSEKRLMSKNVLEFEPAKALFVTDADPLLFYRRIAEFCDVHLEKNGVLYFEINEAFGKETKEMLDSKGFKSIDILQDMQGKDRFVRALK